MKLFRRGRKPIAVNVHLERIWRYGEKQSIRVTTLVMDDGTVWRFNVDGEGNWERFYAPGDEEA